ncbi:cation diffusion facilitator family transporter [Acetobacterium sp.]|uniref:cation diffusion facilitator family transporter n=1 Tax=Acetobacterium sp. TaxID=1872094 RepID=UPI002F42FC8F
MKNFDRKSKTALLSIFSNTLLIILKVVAGILSGSVSIISEAIHSSMDLMASLVAFMSVRTSAKPADRDHPYGHGKIENISGIVEGLLIFIAAGLIIFEAVKKISEPMEIEVAGIAIAVMLTAAVVNFFVSRILYKVGKEEDSMALEADALHLKTDIYTSLGVAAGIILIKLTGILVLDSVVAILVALLIIREAWVLCRNALEFLMDGRLSDIEEQEIKTVIQNVKKECGKELIDFHKLKTRKSGNIRHIDFHITVDPSLTVEAAHEIVGCLKKEICDELKNTRVSVHIDPYHPQKEHDPLKEIKILAVAEDKIRNQ